MTKSQDMTISLKDSHKIHLLNIWLYFAYISKTAKIRGQTNEVNQLDIQMASYLMDSPSYHNN
jgi:hypothetical protein